MDRKSLSDAEKAGYYPRGITESSPYKAYTNRVGLTYPNGHHVVDIRWGELEAARQLNAAFAAGRASRDNEVAELRKKRDGLRKALEVVVYDCEDGAWIKDDIDRLEEWQPYNKAKEALAQDDAGLRGPASTGKAS